MNTFCRIIPIQSEASAPIASTQVVTFVNLIVKKDLVLQITPWLPF
jgi:hypothetical protein